MDLPVIGESFEDRYAIASLLGQGGFATVYKARDTSMQRDVVIKILSPRDGEYPGTVLARFMREARVFAELQDPHTITMYDFGKSSGGLLYMVFEYVAGEELGLLLARQGRLAPEVVAHILSQLLSALQEAHSRGILHRDLKPANILVYRYGNDPYRVKLLDFGIAKDLDPKAEQLTRTGRVVGTVRYMAPEQIFGDEPGPWTDIFSLGLVACELLTGEPVMNGKTQRELLLQQTSESPLLVPAAAAPGALREVIDKMIAREPEARFASAAGVLTALRARNSEPAVEPLKAPKPIVPSEVSKPPRAGLTYILLGFLGVVGAIGIFLVLQDDPQPPPTPAVVHRVSRPAILVKQPAAAVDVGAAPTADIAQEFDASGGCGRPAPRLGAQRLALGHEPDVTVYVPRGYDGSRRVPVMFLFHRQFRTGQQVLSDTMFAEVADEHGFVVIAPTAPRATGWESRDSSRVLVLLADAQEALCLDPERVFAVGDGFGSNFVWRLACRIPLSAYAVTFDAVAKNCEPLAPTPRIRLYGLYDQDAPPEGGWGCNPLAGNIVAADTIERAWKRQYGCSGATRGWGEFPGGECRTWDCERAPLVTCETDAGHQWPGSAGSLVASTCTNPDTFEFPFASAIWAFFDEHHHKLTPEEQSYWDP